MVRRRAHVVYGRGLPRQATGVRRQSTPAAARRPPGGSLGVALSAGVGLLAAGLQRGLELDRLAVGANEGHSER